MKYLDRFIAILLRYLLGVAWQVNADEMNDVDGIISIINPSRKKIKKDCQ